MINFKVVEVTVFARRTKAYSMLSNSEIMQFLESVQEDYSDLNIREASNEEINELVCKISFWKIDGVRKTRKGKGESKIDSINNTREIFWIEDKKLEIQRLMDVSKSWKF